MRLGVAFTKVSMRSLSSRRATASMDNPCFTYLLYRAFVKPEALYCPLLENIFHRCEDRFSRFIGLASKDRGCNANHEKRGVFFEVPKSSSPSLEKLD